MTVPPAMAREKQSKKKRKKPTGEPQKTVKVRTVEEPAVRKRKKRAPVTEYKNARQARKYAALEEFGAKEPITVLQEENGLL
jgi:hypothetical protein